MFDEESQPRLGFGAATAVIGFGGVGGLRTDLVSVSIVNLAVPPSS